MKISAQLAMWGAIVFAAICVGFAITGFSGLDAIPDPEARSDARGFAWFWTFLAFIAVATGVVSWWIVKREDGSEEH